MGTNLLKVMPLKQINHSKWLNMLSGAILFHMRLLVPFLQSAKNILAGWVTVPNRPNLVWLSLDQPNLLNLDEKHKQANKNMLQLS